MTSSTYEKIYFIPEINPTYKSINHTTFLNLYSKYNDFFDEFYNEYNSKPFVKGINKINNEKLLILFLKYKGSSIPDPRWNVINFYSDRGLVSIKGNINEIYDKDCINDTHYELKKELCHALWCENIVLFFNEQKNKLYIHFGETTHSETKNRQKGLILKNANIIKEKIKIDELVGSNILVTQNNILDNVNTFSNLESTFSNLERKYTEILNEFEKNKFNNVKIFSILENKIDTQQKQIDELIKNQQIMTDKHNELVNRLLDRIVELSGKN
jgi:uncharacterized protein YhbP (UPF0306 family)